MHLQLVIHLQLGLHLFSWCYIPEAAAASQHYPYSQCCISAVSAAFEQLIMHLQLELHSAVVALSLQLLLPFCAASL